MMQKIERFPARRNVVSQSALTRMRTRLGPESGQALLEFAVIVPLVVLLGFGIIDFSRAFNYQNNETQLANEAVRYAAVGACGGCSSITAAVTNDAETSELRNSASIALCLVNGAAAFHEGDPIRADVSYIYHWLPSTVGSLGLPSTVRIAASATQPLEKDVVPGSDPYGPLPGCS